MRRRATLVGLLGMTLVSGCGAPAPPPMSAPPSGEGEEYRRWKELDTHLERLARVHTGVDGELAPVTTQHVRAVEDRLMDGRLPGMARRVLEALGAWLAAARTSVGADGALLSGRLRVQRLSRVLRVIQHVLADHFKVGEELRRRLTPRWPETRTAGPATRERAELHRSQVRLLSEQADELMVGLRGGPASGDVDTLLLIEAHLAGWLGRDPEGRLLVALGRRIRERPAPELLLLSVHAHLTLLQNRRVNPGVPIPRRLEEIRLTGLALPPPPGEGGYRDLRLAYLELLFRYCWEFPSRRSPADLEAADRLLAVMESVLRAGRVEQVEQSLALLVGQQSDWREGSELVRDPGWQPRFERLRGLRARVLSLRGG